MRGTMVAVLTAGVMTMAAAPASALDLDVIGTPAGDDFTVHDVKSATVYGEGGNDHLTVGDGVGTVAVYGGDGDDTISARNGHADHIFCGDGNDTVSADASDIVAADCESVSIG